MALKQLAADLNDLAKPYLREEDVDLLHAYSVLEKWDRFARLAAIILEESGVEIPADKRALLVELADWKPNARPVCAYSAFLLSL